MEQREAVVTTGLNGSGAAKAVPIGANGSEPARKDARRTVLTFSYAPSGWDGEVVVPMLRLQGKWLLQLGWKAGQKVIVEADRDEICIVRVDGVEDPP